VTPDRMGEDKLAEEGDELRPHQMPRERKAGSPLGAAIREHRLAHGLNQQEFASYLGVNQSQVARWETGTTREISYRSRELLADAGIDRTLLGLTGLDFDRVRPLVEAARDAVLSNAKPLLAIQILSLPVEWANRWHPCRTSGPRAGKQQLAIIGEVNFCLGLAKSLTSSTPASSAVMNSMWNAELVARQIPDEQSRLHLGSDALMISGNESRKIGLYEDALVYLRKAQQWAHCAGLARREAEAYGLSAYAHALAGHSRDYRAALESASIKLIEADAAGPIDVSESIFSELSLAETKLQCMTVAGSRRELKKACMNLEVPSTADVHWNTYYANTAGQALLKLRDPDAFDWLEKAVHLGIQLGVKGYLRETLRSIKGYETERARKLHSLLEGYLQSE
jgi:transcriptional regulator with XRE-family HTH domain